MNVCKYLDGIKGAIIKQIDEYERGKAELTEEEVKAIMPKVMAFYNKCDPVLR